MSRSEFGSESDQPQPRRKPDEQDEEQEKQEKPDTAAPDAIEQVNIRTPTDWGRFAHSGYLNEADLRYEDVDMERDVRIHVGDPEKSRWGRVDLMVNEKHLFDFKTNDMRDWQEKDAVSHGHKHGEQVRAYLDSPDVPPGMDGWVVATVPPESAAVRQTYEATLAGYGVGLICAEDEQPETVLNAIDKVVSK